MQSFVQCGTLLTDCGSVCYGQFQSISWLDVWKRFIHFNRRAELNFDKLPASNPRFLSLASWLPTSTPSQSQLISSSENIACISVTAPVQKVAIVMERFPRGRTTLTKHCYLTQPNIMQHRSKFCFWRYCNWDFFFNVNGWNTRSAPCISSGLMLLRNLWLMTAQSPKPSTCSVKCVNCSERPAFLIASACSLCFIPHFLPWNIFLDCGPVYGCVCVSVSLCWADEQAGVPLQNAVMHPEYVHIKILITSCWSRLWTSSALAVFSGGCSSTPKIPQHICY